MCIYWIASVSLCRELVSIQLSASSVELDKSRLTGAFQNKSIEKTNRRPLVTGLALPNIEQVYNMNSAPTHTHPHSTKNTILGPYIKNA